MTDQAALFQRGEIAEHREVEASPKAEHRSLPAPPPKEQRMTLTLSFDSEAERAQLIEQLGVRVTNWSCYWPAESDPAADHLQLDI